MQPYPRELRERIVAAVDAGEPPDEVAERFAVSVATIYRYLARRREQGHLEPTPKPGRPRSIPSAADAALHAQVAAAQDATLEDHCTAWAEAGGKPVHVSTMWRALARLALTPKKRPCTPVSKTP
jgi:transposase